MKDIVFASYTPTWKLHRKIAGKALRYGTGYRIRKKLDKHRGLSRHVTGSLTRMMSRLTNQYMSLSFYANLETIQKHFRESIKVWDEI